MRKIEIKARKQGNATVTHSHRFDLKREGELSESVYITVVGDCTIKEARDMAQAKAITIKEAEGFDRYKMVF